MRHYYAKQSPRGFANEIEVHKFESRAERDAWVEKHRNDGDVNSAACGAEPCAAAEARHILGRKSDALTEQYNDLIDHNIPEGDENDEYPLYPESPESAETRARELAAPRPPDRFAAYDDEGIWATSSSPKAAIERFAYEGRLAPDEIPATMRTAPMTYRLAEKVEREGYDYTHPGYSWRVLSDGALDLDEGGQQ